MFQQGLAAYTQSSVFSDLILLYIFYIYCGYFDSVPMKEFINWREVLHTFNISLTHTYSAWSNCLSPRRNKIQRQQQWLAQRCIRQPQWEIRVHHFLHRFKHTHTFYYERVVQSMTETPSEMNMAPACTDENRVSDPSLSYWHNCISHTSVQLAALFN